MFGLLSSLAKATVGLAVQTPIALLKDTSEFIGLSEESKKSHTEEALKNVGRNLNNAVDPNK